MDVRVQFVRCERLLYIVVYPQFIPPLHVLGRSQGRGKEDWRETVCLADVPYHLKTVHNGHVDVAYDDVRLVRFPSLQAFGAVGGGCHLVTSHHVFQARTNNIC